MADVPYNPVPTVQPNGAGLPEQNVSADPAAFGAAFDQSLERFGARVTDIQDREFAQQLQFAQMREETSALNAATQFSQATTNSEVNFSKLRGQQAVDALPQFQADLDKQQAEIAKTLKSPMAQRAYAARSASYKVATFKSLGLHAATQSEVAMDAASAAAVSAAQSRFANHYGLADVEPDLNEIVALSAQQAMDKGLPKEAADVLIQKNTGDALAMVIGARIFNGNAAGAEEIFKAAAQQKVPGTDLPLLDGEHLVSLGAGVKRAKEAEALDAIQAEERAHRAQEAQRRERSNDWLKKIYEGKATATAILADNVLDPFGQGGKEELIGILERHSGTGGSLKDDPITVMDLWRRTHLPDGDPNKIVDDRQLNPYIGRGLNEFATTNNLRNEIQGQNTAQGEITTQMKKNIINEAERALVKANPFTGLLDPNDAAGRAQLSKFTSWFLQQFYAEVAAGKKPMDLLDANSKDYLGKYIENFRLNPQQALAAQAQAARRALGQPGTTVAPSQAAPIVAPQAPPPPTSGTNITIPLAPSGRRAATAFPKGMIEPGELNPLAAGNNWTTVEFSVDGYHKTFILPTKPGDRPADEKTGFLGDAALRWKKDHQSYGVFESGGEKDAAAFMHAAQSGGPTVLTQPKRTPGETPEQYLRRRGM